jgi:kynurenine formamidase
MTEPDEAASLDAWIERLRRLRTEAPPGGTLDYVDAACRRRAAAAVRRGECVNLARILDPSADPASPRLRLTTSFEARDRLTVGFDTVEVSQHGVQHTHLDAWSHYGVDKGFFRETPVGRAEDASVECFAARGVVTRAVLLDLTAVRGTEWIDAEHPATAADLDAALAAAGGVLTPGDAALIYMGRDRFERAGNAYRTVPESVAAGEPRPGLGASAAAWIAERKVSVVCWDFLDAVHETEPRSPAHLLIWAIGLGLVDNCELGLARDALRSADAHDGMLVVAPLRLRGATASLVSPLLVW